MLSVVNARRVTLAVLRPEVGGDDLCRDDDDVNSFDMLVRGPYNQRNASR